jgi:multiple sugar transport system permease protein
MLGLTAVYTTFQLPFGLFLMRNSFAALILLTDQEKFTLPVSLSIIDWGVLQAGVAMTIVPCIVIYLVWRSATSAGCSAAR